jgi:16S rRNA (guanine527-N7)-methyltransferase
LASSRTPSRRPRGTAKFAQWMGTLGMELSPRQAEQFELYYREIMTWNKRAGLTAITDHQEVQTKHFVDSATVALALTPEETNRPSTKIIDIGTGAGFPGLPLKILLRQPRLTLLDSTAKKAAFLRHVVEKLNLPDVEVVNDRAERIAHLPQYREQFDVVVSRAVASLATLVELALPFCRPGGKFLAQKKGHPEQEIREAGRAIEVLGGRLSEVRQIELEVLPDIRYLVVVSKVSPTPENYPRRPGVPGKRPILP